MPEKICKNCSKPIPAGEEIKIERGLRTYEYSVNRGGKYWEGYQMPIEKAFYYLCRPCFKEYEKELAKETTKTRKTDIFVILIILLGIVVFVVGLIFGRESKK